MVKAAEKRKDQIVIKGIQDIARRLKLNNVEESLYFPKNFQLETAGTCNARCPFCTVE